MQNNEYGQVDHMCAREAYPCFKGPGDPCKTQYWAGKQLNYTRHARDEALAESIPFEACLPPWATLCDTDINDYGIYAVVFKVPDEKEGYFMVLGNDRNVITTYRKNTNNRKEMIRMRKAKDKRKLNERR